jgi:hypothetical protein
MNRKYKTSAKILFGVQTTKTEDVEYSWLDEYDFKAVNMFMKAFMFFLYLVLKLDILQCESVF